MFAPPPCCPYPQVTSAQSFEQLQHPMPYAPPLSQLQEPIIINVPNPELSPFASASSCSVGLSPSFEMLHHPPMMASQGECFQLSADGPPPPPSGPVPGQPFFPDERLRTLPESQQRHPFPFTQHSQLQPPPHLQHPQTFIDPSGNLVVPVSGQPGPGTMMFPPQGDQLIQVMPVGPPNSGIVAGPVAAASGQVAMPQFHLPHEMPRFMHPQPFASQQIQTPLIVAMPPCPPLQPGPMIVPPSPTGPLPPPPPPPPAQVLMTQQPVVSLQPPIVPLQTMQQHPAGPMIPVFNQVPMITVDLPTIPCSPLPVNAEHNHSPAMPAQNTGVRPLMDIKDDDKNMAKKNAIKAGCVFCRSNGEREREYMGHRLKNPVTNIVECPQLRKFVCPICGANGDSAHTVSYCPANNKWTGSTVKHLKAMRSSAGKKCGRNVAKAGE